MKKKYLKKIICAFGGVGLLSILYNIVYFALGKRVFVYKNVELRGVRRIKTCGLLRLGSTGYGFLSKRDCTVVNIMGGMEVNGNFKVSAGSRIDVTEGGSLQIGSGYIGPNTKIICTDHIEIGNNCAISWDCTLMDTDFHKISHKLTSDKKNGVYIGNNVLIMSGVKILNGARVADGSVVAAGSIITSQFYEPNVLIAGIPARIVRHNVRWS